MKRSMFLSAALAITFASCAGPPPDDLTKRKFIEDPTEDPTQAPGLYVGGEKNTFSHQSELGGNGVRDPFDILAQRQEEGPPEVRTRLHSCQKLQYATLRNVLVSFGVDINATANPPAAGELFKGGAGALGAANYDARIGEPVVWSSAGAAKLFDIFVQAAPEIIANMPNVDQCKAEGMGAQMFDDKDQCTPDGISCLIGRPATASHVTICSSLVKSASSIDVGKKIAVATLLSAAHSCE
jgi:hypothetical protein